MEEKYLKILQNYCSEKGWNWVNNREVILEILNENNVYSESVGHSRHWEDYFCVANINGHYIGYNDVSVTGDMNKSEVGFEFDFKSLCEVEPYEVMETKWREKGSVIVD